MNKDFVHKFIADDAAGVTFVGGKTFSTRTGAYSPAGETAGVLTVRFRADGAGSATVSGTVKTCVCTDKTCITPEAAIALRVPMR
jgi:hypothetical protein